jgi:hypothetical protein
MAKYIQAKDSGHCNFWETISPYSLLRFLATSNNTHYTISDPYILEFIQDLSNKLQIEIDMDELEFYLGCLRKTNPS